MDSEGETPQQESRRTFFALLPDEAAVEYLCGQLAFLKRELPDSPVRWVRPENWHLTLRFLGKTEFESFEKLISLAHSHGFFCKPITFRISRPRLFPNQRRPAAVAADIEESDALLGLAERIEKVAVACGFQPESRNFRPHLTLGRIKRGVRIRLPEIEDSWVESKADEFVLMESKTAAEGAVYTPIQRFALGRQ